MEPRAGWMSFEQALLNYDKPEVERILRRERMTRGGQAFIEEFIVKAMQSIGARWEKGEVALSQIYMSSRLCEDIAVSLLPDCPKVEREITPIGILTLDDHHTMGKRIVGAVVRAAGYPLQDFGIMTNPEEITRLLEAEGIRILLISVLMYPSALHVKALSRLLKARGLSVRLLVGGAPFRMDPLLWRIVEADAMGASASDCVAILEQWLEEMPCERQ